MERAEGSQIPAETPKRSMEYRGQQFEIEDVSVLSGKDMQLGDRVFISTESGNRYMIRVSKSLGGLKIYNEKADGFKVGNVLYDSGESLAEVGKPFDFTFYISNDKGQKYQATTVTAIEIRRGLDKAIEDSETETSGHGMAQMLKDQVHGREKK